MEERKKGRKGEREKQRKNEWKKERKKEGKKEESKKGKWSRAEKNVKRARKWKFVKEFGRRMTNIGWIKERV